MRNPPHLDEWKYRLGLGHIFPYELFQILKCSVETFLRAPPPTLTGPFWWPITSVDFLSNPNFTFRLIEYDPKTSC